MQNKWNAADAAQYQTALEQRVYSSRLLGQDPALVLHGGGNTSVKAKVKNIFGDDEDILYVKGSGWDLATIEARGFSPCRLAVLLKLAELEKLSDTDMARELQISMTDPSAPAPSVEAILHALLPHPFVDHTHADAAIAVTNAPNGEARVREIYGDDVIIIPYVMPGFKLVREVAKLYQAQVTEKTIGLILLNHGVFSFGATAKESYDRMIELVSRSEVFKVSEVYEVSEVLKTLDTLGTSETSDISALAALRANVSLHAGFPLIMSTHSDETPLNFARRVDIQTVSQQGTATPDHVIRTKRVPLIGRDVAAYSEAYKKYFEENATRNSPPASRTPSPLIMLDPAPRVILDPELGLLTLGRSASDAAIAEDIYRHTIEIITQADSLGGFQSISVADAFDMEYWDLEQAKLKRAGAPKIFAGEIALVTGAASGIGKACVASLLARGAAVVGLDINPAIATLHTRKDFLGITCDVTDESALANALEETTRHFGGLDMLILNAGIFPPSKKIAELSNKDWDTVMSINLDSNLTLMRLAHPLLKLAPRNGRVVVIGSKNVPAPGPGVGAYSAAKAALTQLARVAALEWGADKIRVNILHPNAVFDTGIWTEETLVKRAANYKMSVDEYKTSNVLRVEVTSRDVAELAAEMCGALFAKITGAQLPIDGGNDRVI